MIPLTLSMGALNSMTQNARLGMLRNLVPESSGMNALAVNAFTYNATRMVGPALGGA